MSKWNLKLIIATFTLWDRGLLWKEQATQQMASMVLIFTIFIINLSNKLTIIVQTILYLLNDKTEKIYIMYKIYSF